MRILCARYAHLGLITALRRYPELRGEAVIVGGAPELRLPVIAASAAARAAGVQPGQPLRQAQQLCPRAAFVPLDSGAMAQQRDSLCASLHQLSPAVEVGEEESLCDLSGSHVAYADEAGWASAAARRLCASLDAEPPAVGVAGSRFVARMAARASQPGRIRRVQRGSEAAFLAPLPLDVLPIEASIAARLAAFGLDCIGAVAALSPADLQRQFGAGGIDLHRLARGEDAGGIHPDPGLRVWSERLVFDGSIGDLETLLRAAQQCVEALGGRLLAAGLAAGEVGVALELEEGRAITEAVVPAAPLGNGAEAWTAMFGLLGGMQLPGPVAAVRVLVTRLAPVGGRQADLLRPGDGARETILVAAQRLRLRFGDAVVRRPVLAVDPGDLPERRFTWESPAVAASR